MRGFYKEKYNIKISKMKSGKKLKSLLEFYYQNKIILQDYLYFKIMIPMIPSMSEKSSAKFRF